MDIKKCPLYQVYRRKLTNDDTGAKRCECGSLLKGAATQQKETVYSRFCKIIGQ